MNKLFIYTYKHINIEKLADNVVAADFSYLIFNKIIDNAKKKRKKLKYLIN